MRSAHDVRRVGRESVKVFLKSRLYIYTHVSFISEQLFIHRLRNYIYRGLNAATRLITLKVGDSGKNGWFQN
jgi:hypothetical protein